ncbi:MAG: S41 family peptidase [Chitinophagaceae bacterium]
MKKQLYLFILLFNLFTTSQIIAQDVAETRVFQPAQMQEDFNYLRKALEETHPGLYMHHTKEEMEFKMDSLYKLLDKPLPFLQFYKIIAYLVAEVKCEHTYCNPYSDYQKRVMQWKMFPFQPFFINNKSYIAINRTADTSIHPGDEIVSINNRPIDSIKTEIFKYLPVDGNMVAAKENMISSLNFNIYYCQYIEQPSSYDVTMKKSDGKIITRHYESSLTFGENTKITIDNPVNREIIDFAIRNAKIKKNPWRLEIIKEQNTAIITINSFGGDRKKLFKLYDQFFSTLQKEKIGNLIIDLSYNDGGDEEYACELLSYLIDKPTRFIESEYLINDSEEYKKISNYPKDVLADWNSFVEPMKDGKAFAKPLTKYSMELKTFDPKPNRFTGNVYFYVNGGTSSAASTCAANAKSHRLATIVGNETAGSFAGGGSTNGLDLVLPNSKITAHTSVVYCVFSTEGGDKDRGTIPDYYFTPSLSAMYKDPDGWKNFIYDLIKKKK